MNVLDTIKMLIAINFVTVIALFICVAINFRILKAGLVYDTKLLSLVVDALTDIAAIAEQEANSEKEEQEL